MGNSCDNGIAYAFYFTDHSDMQAAVMIDAKAPDGTRELHDSPVNISKNHENNDALSFSPWEKKPADELDVSRRILPDKL